MTTTYKEFNGTWSPIKNAFVERNGEWVPQLLRLVGHEGRWLETYKVEQVSEKEIIDVTRLSYRAGAPMQGALDVMGRGFDATVMPDPPVGAFYPLTANFADRLENFANIVPHGTELPIPTIIDGLSAYLFDTSKKQYLSLPLPVNSTDAYYDLLGLVGNDWGSIDTRGEKHWEIGGKFQATSLPATGEVAFLLFSGTATQNISVGFDSTGMLFAQLCNGTYKKRLEIPGVISVGEWAGFVFRHRPSGLSRFLELQAHTGEMVSVEGDILRSVSGSIYKEFSYWLPAPDQPINVGYGEVGTGTVFAEKFFSLDNTSPNLTISEDGLQIQSALTTYRNGQPSGPMPPGTGRYYIEIKNNDSYDIHFGVTDAAPQTNLAPGQIGWCVNTIGGRKFAKQTGGGTDWTAVMPYNSTIGLVYDSDAGLIEVYVDGTKWANPFAAGTITNPVQFIIGGRAGTATTNLFRAAVVVSPDGWTLAPASVIPFPFSSTIGEITDVFSGGAYREMFIRNAPMTPARTALVITPGVTLDVVFTNMETGVSYSAKQSILKSEPNKLIISVPQVPDGNYEVDCRYEGVEESNRKIFTVRSFQARTTPLHVNFATDTVDHIRSQLMVAHKQWGGANGGVSSENVLLDRLNGVCEITALGDNYVGPIRGTNRTGGVSDINVRIGGCIVTRDYFGPGSYRILCKPASLPGVCTALWTFHYEEGYLGSVLYDLHQQDGIHISGEEVNGFYTVRNHEIDIEFPTALKSNPNQEDVSFRNARFNTWRGELRNWSVPNPDVPVGDAAYSPVPDQAYWSEYTDDFVNHDVNLADQQYHELRFDWHLGDDPRVEYYIDGVLMHTVRTHIPDIPGRYWAGMWFPSGSTQWAGRGAAWIAQHMLVKELTITPFADEAEFSNNVVETYPLDVYHDFKRFRYE